MVTLRRRGLQPLVVVRRAGVLDASSARRDADARSEAARRQQEADLGRRARRRLWALVASFVLLAALGGVLTIATLADRARATVAFFGFRGDNAYDANVAAGLDRAARELDIELVEVSPIVDVHRQLIELAATGSDLIITSGGTACGRGR
jgi:hypothetical protein